MRGALETNQEKESAPIRDALIMAAAQWILWHGQGLFLQLRYQGDISALDKQAWTPGELYSAKKDEVGLTLRRWRFWRTRFGEVAQEANGTSEECKAVAGKVVDMMDVIEKSMTF